MVEHNLPRDHLGRRRFLREDLAGQGSRRGGGSKQSAGNAERGSPGRIEQAREPAAFRAPGIGSAAGAAAVESRLEEAVMGGGGGGGGGGEGAGEEGGGESGGSPSHCGGAR